MQAHSLRLNESKDGRRRNRDDLEAVTIKSEAKENNEAARMWTSPTGLDGNRQRKLGIQPGLRT